MVMKAALFNWVLRGWMIEKQMRRVLIIFYKIKFNVLMKDIGLQFLIQNLFFPGLEVGIIVAFHH